MAHMVGDIAKFFRFDETDIDNWNFKLYYKGCVILFFCGSMVGVLNQYFGDPIQCDFKGIDADLASDYCWIHGSSFIPAEYQPHMKCIADLDGVQSEDDAPDTSYYQWVTFFQLFQAGLFLLPYKMWTAFEGGLLASFGNEAKSLVMISEEDKMDEGVVKEMVVNKFVKFFKSTMHHNQRYFIKFVFCECLNMILAFFNFWATDKFLQGRFRYYGIDVVQFYQMSSAERKVNVNPMCATFPTEVSCTVPNIGAAGGEQHNNALCVLSQNIINEKVYLVSWFYMTFVCSFSLLYLVYRICTIFFEQVRFFVLYMEVSHDDDDLKKALRFVLGRCYVGDWFVLKQLHGNVSPYFFRYFIKELKKELKERPKKRCASPVNKDDGTLPRRGDQKAVLNNHDDNATLLANKAK